MFPFALRLFESSKTHVEKNSKTSKDSEDFKSDEEETEKCVRLSNYFFVYAWHSIQVSRFELTLKGFAVWQNW